MGFHHYILRPAMRCMVWNGVGNPILGCSFNEFCGNAMT